MVDDDPLKNFLPPVRHWFRHALGEPTPAQRQGWPSIAAGRHTLILAPTGSGKTLAAFLACLDGLWRQSSLPRGVQVLYISPLKALNNDIHRNLQIPLEGVAQVARELRFTLPTIEAAVRTGDTPAAERQRLVRKPPHVLITTPESLHLLLTSRARDTLRGVTHCVIDEIHALCPNKRGVFLALLLERLEALNPRGFVRIGLSATQRPLDEVARYLGGNGADGQPRPVNIIDAGVRRDLDLQVVSPVEQFGPLPEQSIWPSIYRLLDRELRQHRSTIVFANNRRTVERITAQLNNDSFSRAPEASAPVARAHHGSVALEVRQDTERALKEGQLRTVVATASLELGIDMGAVDLVCQVESPGNVARGLQRVGRAGHVVGQRSKGRLIPKTSLDLIEQAALARAMIEGRVEEVCCPRNCLDVLAQQVVAMAALDAWEVPALYALVRRAYPFRDLSPEVFHVVLEMVSGRYAFRTDAVPARAGTLTALQPRISWDRVHNRLHGLPGSQQLALVSGGTIPDTGQYGAYTMTGVRIGELDEEFVYERRIGDAFLLGTHAWRVERIEADRVLVTPAEGAPAMVPFWRGEGASRSRDLGLAIGRLLREVAARPDRGETLDWLQRDYHLDAWAARNLLYHVRRQLALAGCLPTDRTLVVEASRDPLGDWQVILLCPFGGRLNLALRLAIEHRLTQRLGYRPQCLHHNDGVLIRLTDTDEPVLDLFEGLTADNVEGMILDELADSALFALRFRQNAARALLLPRGQAGKRAPLWLQRLRGRDLLQVARQHPDFPIVAETFRECLQDHLDLPHLRELLAQVQAGEIEVQVRRADAPSPFAGSMLFAFTAANMYEFDRTENAGRAPNLDDQLLRQLVAPEQAQHLLDPRAIQQVERRLRGIGMPPRSPAEAAEWLRRLGDVTPGELEGPLAAFLQALETEGRAQRIELPNCREPLRWVLTEDAALYRTAFGLGETTNAAPDPQPSAETILQRFLATHALVGLRDILDRYPFDRRWAERQLRDWSESGRLVAISGSEGGQAFKADASRDEELRWSAPENLEQVQRGSLALLRREVQTCPPAQFADFLLRWQAAHPATRRGGAEGLAEVLERLQGIMLPDDLWERVVLPARVSGYQPRWLDEQIAGGHRVWVGWQESDGAARQVAFWPRGGLVEISAPEVAALDGAAGLLLERLQQRGASFLVDLAADTKLPPSLVRTALWQLVRRRLVTNDRFDVVRRGEAANNEPQPAAGRIPAQRPTRRPAGASLIPEGRWSLVPWGQPDAVAQANFRAHLLLQRYGLAARELALLDPDMPPWRVLYEVLNRLELTGEVRRGYFVEGLSGAQFALPEAVEMLQACAVPSTAAAPVVLLHSLDPANLYGSGAPFDIALLDGGTRPLLRRAGNWLVLRAGRPILIVEQQGKKLTALASASRDDLTAAVARLPDILATTGVAGNRHKISVAEWNGEPVSSSAGAELLEAVGFVRDYQEMTLYAAWR
ncbi:MAG: DEAD/DEAH box helicase [Planctomycetia bacterium]|nr:DEAD/DEAH box helicase [Planctomycetia bacterium]